MKILVLNCGSSSLKFQLINMDNNERMAKGNFERIGGMKTTLHLNINGKKEDLLHIARDYDEAIEFVLKKKKKTEYGLIKSLDEIGAVGHRIVHGGEMFSSSVVINDEVVSEIEKCIDLAPLHNPAGVAGIKAAQKVLPNIPMVAVFDTAFHQTMPKERYIYPIPYEYYEKYGIRKYGFHGTSHRFINKTISEYFERNDLKIISCHIGNGGSVTAIDSGKVVDTSMGFTPLAGIMMGTRSGDIDPSILEYVSKKTGESLSELTKDLNKKSGLLGVSGVSSDSRDVETAAEEGNERAILAQEIYARKIANYIAMYNNLLNGADVICLTAGVGENSKKMRKMIIEHIASLGVKIDDARNDCRGEFRLISAENSKIPVYVVPTNEELMIAIDTMELAQKKN